MHNPFGEDDEDFELNELPNRHFKVAMSIVVDSKDPRNLKKIFSVTNRNINFEEKSDSENLSERNGNNRDTML